MGSLETWYYVANIVMPVTIIITLIVFIWNVRKRNQALERSKALESLRILEKFQDEIIPKINSYMDNVKKSVDEEDLTEVFLKKTEIEKLSAHSNGKFRDIELVKRATKESIVRSRAGGSDVLNQLEHICAFVEHDICDESMLIDPISNIVLDFKDRNEVFLIMSRMVESGGDYKNLLNTYNKWKNEKEKSNKQKEIDKKREELRQLENGTL